MAFRVIWSESALADLREVVRYIARDDRRAAGRFGQLILSKVDAVASFPRSGRIVPEYRIESLHEIIVRPYRIVFRVDDANACISIVRVWHGARNELDPGD